jgi:uncharacterized protein (DUF4213/DUF364 family)
MSWRNKKRISKNKGEIKMSCDNLFDILRADFEKKIIAHNLMNESINISCKALSAKQAIGTPDHDDYPIIRGKEVMIEADFAGAKGQAFSDEFENKSYTIKELLSLNFDNNRERASFVAGLNAVYRYLGLTDKTIHCRDNEPVECAKVLPSIFPENSKILLIGHQPRFLEVLARSYQVRAIDLNEENVGKNFSDVLIEHESKTQEAIDWCDTIFATGSTLVNNTISTFSDSGKPAIFYGVTISAPAKILGLKSFCEKGK